MYLLQNISNIKASLSGLLLSFLALSSVTISTTAIACPSQPYIGGMCAFAGNFAPRNWAFANGQLLAISQNTALFSLLGTYYGGDGRTTFALPDLRGRGIIGAGHGPGLSNYAVGQKSGVERVTLTVLQMPAHIHGATTNVDLSIDPADVSVSASLNAHSGPGSATSPESNMLAQNTASNVYSSTAPNVAMNTAAIEASASGSVSAPANTVLQSFGGNQSHENRMPYLAVNWIVAQFGTYPSRN